MIHSHYTNTKAEITLGNIIIIIITVRVIITKYMYSLPLFPVL